MIKKEYKLRDNVSYQDVINILDDIFKGDKDKILSFYLTKQPIFGGISPYEMIKLGKSAKLMKALINIQQGNWP